MVKCTCTCNWDSKVCFMHWVTSSVTPFAQNCTQVCRILEKKLHPFVSTNYNKNKDINHVREGYILESRNALKTFWVSVSSVGNFLSKPEGNDITSFPSLSTK